MNQQLKKNNPWSDIERGETYLELVRNAIPLADVELDIAKRLLRTWVSKKEIPEILDLGCGDGYLAKNLLEVYPNANITLIDISTNMLDKAESLCSQKTKKINCILSDFSNPDWVNTIETKQFDIIVSGLAIHHLPDDKKLTLYNDIYNILSENGVFMNFELVSSLPSVDGLFEEFFFDSLYNYNKNWFKGSRDKFIQYYKNRKEDEVDILASVSQQCKWLDSIGYTDVDCFFKAFGFALFGGRKNTIVEVLS